MDIYYGNTISIPIWIDTRTPKVFVPTVDIPTGSWILILSLTPLGKDPAEEIAGWEIVKIDFNEAPGFAFLTRPFPGSFRMQASLENKLESKEDPRAVSYSITLKNQKGLEIRHDPMVVLQPDPIYPFARRRR